MDTEKWFACEPCSRGVVASCVGRDVQLIHDRDSLSWSTELVDAFADAERLTLIVDLSNLDYISLIAIRALANLDSLLAERSGTLELRGLRPWVLGAVLAIEPRLDASGQGPMVAATWPKKIPPKRVAA